MEYKEPSIMHKDVAITQSEPCRWFAREVQMLAGVLASLRADGTLSASQDKQIRLFCQLTPTASAWQRFLMRLFSTLGLLALAIGLLFFIASNWPSMAPLSRFVLVEMVVLALTILVWWRWSQWVASVALIALGLVLGALLGLYGQTYQSGAQSWQLFQVWTLILLPLALVSRQNSLWFFSWLTANIGYVCYFSSGASFSDGVFNTVEFAPFWAMFLSVILQFICLAMREAIARYVAARIPHSPWAGRWFSRTIASYLMFSLTLLMVRAIAHNADGYDFSACLLWLVVMVTGYWCYRYRTPDLFMLTLGIVSLMSVGIALLCLWSDSWFIHNGITGLSLLFFLIMLWLVAGGIMLLTLLRRLLGNASQGSAQGQLSELLNLLQHYQLAGDELWQHMQFVHLGSLLPWYVRTALAVVGWLAGGFSLLLLMSLSLTGMDGTGIMAGCSLVLALLARFLLASKSITLQQIGLVWAIAATGGIYLSGFLSWDVDISRDACLFFVIFLPVLVVLFFAISHDIYRLMAAVCAFLTLMVALSAVMRSWLLSFIGFSHFAYVESLPFALITCGLVVLWAALLLYQHHCSSRHYKFLMPLLNAVPISLMIIALLTVHASYQQNWLSLWADHFSSSSMMLGCGMGIGVIVVAAVLMHNHKSALSGLFFLLALVVGALAPFAPGLALGVVLLLFARYQGSLVWLVVSVLFLSCYLFDWYYFLEVSLLKKSLWLCVYGVLALLFCYVVRCLLPTANNDKGTVYAG
jgi:uncharacterized membrane protein